MNFVTRILCLTLYSFAAGVSVAVEATEFVTIGPGTAHKSERLSSGPLYFNVVRVDIANPRITVKAEPGQDSLFHGEAVPDVVKRETATTSSRVLAAVNADFWAMSPRPYTPLGLLVANNMICNMPNPTRSVFAITHQRKARIGPVHLRVGLTSSGGDSLKVDKINDRRGSTESVLLFTPPYGQAIPPFEGTRYIVKLPGGEFLPNKSYKVGLQKVDSATSTALAADTLVLCIPASKSAAWLEKTRTARLLADMPEMEGSVAACVGGGPRLLRDGKVKVAYDEEQMGRSFASDKHPRTAVGITSDARTLYLVTVDGRQPRISVGQNLFELAEFMKKLGCAEAMNLDGGGSTTMVVDKKVVNHPSDLKGPRPVTNSLVVLAEPGSGKIKKLTFEPSGSPLIVPTGVPLRLQLHAFDETDTPVPINASGVLSATVENISERTKAAGDTVELQISDTPGNGRVRVQMEGGKGELEVRAMHASGLKVQPEMLLLDKGEQEQLDVQLLAGDSALTLQPEMVSLAPADDSVSCTQLNVIGAKSGRGWMKVSLGASSTTIPYFVDQSSHTLLASFDHAEKHLGIRGTNFEGAETAVQQVADQKKEGAGALAVQYAMSSGGRSRIYVPVGSLIEKPPVKLGLWIHGDGKQAWVRANLVDARGTTFTADFTDGSKGVYWNNEWRRGTCLFKDLLPESSSSSAKPQLPLIVKEVYVAQDQEALKATGRILLDALEAEYPPADFDRRKPVAGAIQN